jgi:hypothetical protein
MRIESRMGSPYAQEVSWATIIVAGDSGFRSVRAGPVGRPGREATTYDPSLGPRSPTGHASSPNSIGHRRERFRQALIFPSRNP